MLAMSDLPAGVRCMNRAICTHVTAYRDHIAPELSETSHCRGNAMPSGPPEKPSSGTQKFMKAAQV